MSHGIRYEFTREAHLLHQYYELVRKCYDADLNVHLDEIQETSLQKHEDQYNDSGHIIVARIGNYVIAGARLVVSSINHKLRLPMEENEFSLPDILPEYSLKNKNYCEFGRLAVLLDFRGKTVVKDLLYYSLSMAQLQDCQYGFWIAPITQAIYYKKVLKKFKINTRIYSGLSFPYNRIYRNIKSKIVLSSCDLTFPDFRHVLFDNGDAPATMSPQRIVA